MKISLAGQLLFREVNYMENSSDLAVLRINRTAELADFWKNYGGAPIEVRMPEKLRLVLSTGNLPVQPVLKYRYVLYGSESFTDGHIVVVSPPDFMFRQEYAEQTWEQIITALTMHEIFHNLMSCFSDIGMLCEQYLTDIGDKSVRKMGGKKQCTYIAKTVLNILEDGRIDYAAVRYFKSMLQPYTILHEENRLGGTIEKVEEGGRQAAQFLNNILALSTAGWEVPGADLYSGTRFEQEFKTIEPLITASRSAETSAECRELARQILISITPYFLTLLNSKENREKAKEELQQSAAGKYSADQAEYSSDPDEEVHNPRPAPKPASGGASSKGQKQQKQKEGAGDTGDADDEKSDESSSAAEQSPDSKSAAEGSSDEPKGSENGGDSSNEEVSDSAVDEQADDVTDADSSTDSAESSKNGSSKADENVPDMQDADTDDSNSSSSQPDASADSEEGEPNKSSSDEDGDPADTKTDDSSSESDSEKPASEQSDTEVEPDTDADADTASSDFSADGGSCFETDDNSSDTESSAAEPEAPNGQMQTANQQEERNCLDDAEDGSASSSHLPTANDSGAENDVGNEPSQQQSDISDEERQALKDRLAAAFNELFDGTEKAVAGDARRTEADSVESVASLYRRKNGEKIPLIETFPEKNPQRLPVDLQEQYRRLKRQLETLLRVHKEDVTGLKTGRLDVRHLYRAGTGCSNIFMRRGQQDGPDTAIELLIDNSGSMSYSAVSSSGVSKAAAAQTAAAVIEAAVSSLAALEVTLFSADCGCDVNSIRHIVLKSFDDTASRTAPGESIIWGGLGRQMIGECNKDGYSIRVAAARLQKRPELNKVLVILSDGLPSAYRSDEDAEEDVKDAVQCARRAGVSVIPIMFGDGEFQEANMASYRSMYGDGVIACAPPEIVERFIDLFKKIIGG